MNLCLYRSCAVPGVLLALALCTAPGVPAQPATAVDAVVLLDAHRARMAGLKDVLAGCVAEARQCHPEEVGADERVQLRPGEVARIRLEWLRQGVRTLGTATGDERKTLAADLSARLARLTALEDAVLPERVQQGRVQVDQVLATKEFRKEPEPTWIERKWRAFVEWLNRIFGKSLDAVSAAPGWLKYVFEALLFLAPAVLLLLWMMRQVREDRMRIAKSGEREERGTLAPANEWLKLAEEFAGQSDWRQAIHALYWATIAGFEKRRVWRTNRTRTPREYLSLLAMDAPARVALMEQTRLFELTWYGYREASSDDYARALQLQSSMEAR
jgi:hypothetical protein